MLEMKNENLVRKIFVSELAVLCAKWHFFVLSGGLISRLTLLCEPLPSPPTKPSARFTLPLQNSLSVIL